MKMSKGRIVYILILSLVLLNLASCGRKKVQVAENEFYVCSMDPQVMEKQPGMCPICKMPLAKTIIDKSSLHEISISDEQARLANIQVSAAEQSFIGKETMLTGVFTINQNRTEQVSARIKGRIEHLYFKVIGEPVRKGDKLYDLYSRELLQAQEEYLLSIEKAKLLQIDGNSLVSSARSRLLLWGLSESQVRNLERTKLPQITNSIYSDASGVITNIPLKEGDYVNEGSEVYRLADISNLWVEAQLFTNELGNLQEGKQVEIIPEPFPEDVIYGAVTFANPELQQETKINLVRVEVANPGNKYKPGMQAYVSLKSGDKKAIVIPADAVIRNSNNNIVWVQKGKGKFEPRNVELGVQNNNSVEIISGLKEGEPVVTSGTYLLNSEFVFKRGGNPMNAMDHSGMKM
jgi:membrane fusion protein, copper/silver efflux system